MFYLNILNNIQKCLGHHEFMSGPRHFNMMLGFQNERIHLTQILSTPFIDDEKHQ